MRFQHVQRQSGAAGQSIVQAKGKTAPVATRAVATSTASVQPGLAVLSAAGPYLTRFLADQPEVLTWMRETDRVDRSITARNCAAVLAAAPAAIPELPSLRKDLALRGLGAAGGTAWLLGSGVTAFVGAGVLARGLWNLVKAKLQRQPGWQPLLYPPPEVEAFSSFVGGVLIAVFGIATAMAASSTTQQGMLHSWVGKALVAGGGGLAWALSTGFAIRNHRRAKAAADDAAHLLQQAEPIQEALTAPAATLAAYFTERPQELRTFINEWLPNQLREAEATAAAQLGEVQARIRQSRQDLERARQLHTTLSGDRSVGGSITLENAVDSTYAATAQQIEAAIHVDEAAERTITEEVLPPIQRLQARLAEFQQMIDVLLQNRDALLELQRLGDRANAQRVRGEARRETSEAMAQAVEQLVADLADMVGQLHEHQNGRLLSAAAPRLAAAPRTVALMLGAPALPETLEDPMDVMDDDSALQSG